MHVTPNRGRTSRPVVFCLVGVLLRVGWLVVPIAGRLGEVCRPGRSLTCCHQVFVFRRVMVAFCCWSRAVLFMRGSWVALLARPCSFVCCWLCRALCAAAGWRLWRGRVSFVWLLRRCLLSRIVRAALSMCRVLVAVCCRPLVATLVLLWRAAHVRYMFQSPSTPSWGSDLRSSSTSLFTFCRFVSYRIVL